VAPSLKHPEALRFARPTRHILPRSPRTNAKLNRTEGNRRVLSARKPSEPQAGTTCSENLYYILTNQLRSLGALRSNHRANYFHHVQASQDELAEPFKYSNTFSSTSTPLWRIEPWRIVQYRSFAVGEDLRSFRGWECGLGWIEKLQFHAQ
jgi:hypothetical protein